jgi:outer membrane receptor protein involved in Fe transport
MASYSKRINRPRSWYLEPFVTYIDESTRRIGNPSLLPEYTDSYELGYLRTLEAGTFTAEAYFRDTRNAITWINYYDEELGYFINTARNLNKERALGIESSLVYDFTSWFNLNLSGTYYYFQLEDLTGQSTELRSSNNWDGRVMASFKLPSQTQFQLNTTYDSPTVTAQGRAEGSWYMDFTVKQEFLKKSLSITLKVSDIFASRTRESYSYGAGFYAYEYNQPESRVVSLTISYRLNNFKKNAALQNMGGNGGGM